jgi:hypothetical protein
MRRRTVHGYRRVLGAWNGGNLVMYAFRVVARAAEKRLIQ